MAEDPVPAADARSPRTARRGALHLVAPPAVFIVHFGAVYALNGLACAFGWPVHAVLGGVLALTVLALATLLGLRPRHRPPPTAAPDADDPYDPRERAHFLALTARMATWLAAAGVLAVALPALLARTCG